MDFEIDLGKVGITPGGAWINTTEYERLTMVSRGGRSYVSRVDNVGVEPGTNPNIWMLVAEKGADGQGGGGGGGDTGTTDIGVQRYSDGYLYWTKNGVWLLDEHGNKVKAQGVDGMDGEDGKDGKDGSGSTVSALASLTDDVNINPSSLVGGEVLQYNGYSQKWVPGSASSGSDSWREIKVKGTTILGTGTNTGAVNFKEGQGISLSGSNGEITITATGGGEGGGGDYYIGNTKAGVEESPNEMLEGLGSIEILGMVTNSGAKKIFFGPKDGLNTPYIEWDSTNSCFHFSHGLYSTEFVSAGGYNGDSGSGGGGGATSLADLTDDVSINPASLVDGQVLMYSDAAGKWVAGTISGDGEGGSITIDSVLSSISTNPVENRVIYAALANKADAADLPSVGSLNTNNSTAQTVSSSESFGGTINLHKIAKTGAYSDLIGGPAALTLGANGFVYDGGTAHTFSVSDLTSIIGTANDSYIQIGMIKLRYNNNRLFVEHVTSGTTADLIASGAITAGE